MRTSKPDNSASAYLHALSRRLLAQMTWLYDGKPVTDWPNRAKTQGIRRPPGYDRPYGFTPEELAALCADGDACLSSIDRFVVMPVKALAIQLLGGRAESVRDVPVGCLPLASVDACIGAAPSGEPFVAIDLGLLFCTPVVAQLSIVLLDPFGGYRKDTEAIASGLVAWYEVARFLLTGDFVHLRNASEGCRSASSTMWREGLATWYVLLLTWVLLHEYEHLLGTPARVHPERPFARGDAWRTALSIEQRRELVADSIALRRLSAFIGAAVREEPSAFGGTAGFPEYASALFHCSLLAPLFYLLDAVRLAGPKRGAGVSLRSHPSPMVRWRNLKLHLRRSLPYDHDFQDHVSRTEFVLDKARRMATLSGDSDTSEDMGSAPER